MLFLSKNNTKSKDPAGCGIGPNNSAGCGICLNFLAGFGIRTPSSGAPLETQIYMCTFCEKARAILEGNYRCVKSCHQNNFNKRIYLLRFPFRTRSLYPKSRTPEI